MDINLNTLLLANYDPDPNYVHPEGRKRFIHVQWPRKPDGPFLEKNKAPYGFRTPNGLVWGHTTGELCYIERKPGVACVSIYSRSQVKELGENYENHHWGGPLVRPRVLRPWPVLKLPKRHPANTDPPIGAIDGGCEEEHSEFKTYTMRWDEFSDDKGKGKGVDVSQRKVPRACSTDPTDPCTGRLLSNDGLNCAKNDDGNVYDYLWCEHFVARLNQQEDPYVLLAHTVHEMAQPRMVADKTGVFMFREFGGWRKYVSGEKYKIPYPFNDPSFDDMTCECQSAAEDVDMQDLSAQEQGDIKERSDVKEKQKAKRCAPGLFSTKDLPKLEEFIPEGLFPDTLLVHDPNKVTNHAQSGKGPIKYKRVYPVLERDGPERTSSSSEALVAQLHLHETNRLGEGHHSYVYRAPLTLPAPLDARSPTGQCTVAAKLAYPRCTAHRLLRNEGEVYNAFPKHLQEDYCGFNIIPPCRYPVPVGAVVPKFFGYYLPVGEDDAVVAESGHEECKEHKPCEVSWASPILLMEECGEPVKPKKFTADQRTECFSLILRLHDLNTVQGSFYVRNVMIQPGPLTQPPEKRTFESPSFRIIDFGRGMRYRQGVDAPSWFAARIREEQERARAEILLEHPCGY